MLYGWVPFSVAMFLFMRPRRAAAVVLIGGWLFLPQFAYDLPRIPDYGKATAIATGLLLGITLIDSRRLFQLRPAPIDIFMILWCTVPMVTSILNDLGAYDGASAVIGHIVVWGVPWLVGRLYFSSREGLRELAVAVFIGGLIYVPLCLLENRLAPILHYVVYGFNQHVFAQTRRFGGWRPVVFLEHGLAVGMWMTATSVTAFWLWLSGAKKRIVATPTGWLLTILLATTILTRSLGALLLLAVAIPLLLVARRLRTVWPILLLGISVPIYLVLRIVFDWRAEILIDLAGKIHPVRARSLAGRLEVDAILAERALQRPFFGWGGWDRMREGVEFVIPDTMWSITLGQYGFIGLVSLYGALLVPPLAALWGLRHRPFRRPEWAGVVALSLVVILFLCDSFSNRMISPVYTCAAAALVGWSDLR
ncbi:MAG: hypothetical protein R3336_08955, partial [Phycisphaeraceae bacterium]|nr:hypothetical protein [Phycisphaeraceae bacterium]